MGEYNERRTNQGKRCDGRTPMQTFLANKELCDQYIPEVKLPEEKNTTGNESLN